MKKIILALSTIATVGAGFIAQSSSFAKAKTISSSSSYRIILEDPRWAGRPFTVDIPSENTEGIEGLESYIGKNGNKIQRDINGKIINLEIGAVNGAVEKTTPTQTHRWNFKLDPKTVEFSDVHIELCDGNFDYVERNLDQWMTEVGRFCPWNTQNWIKDIIKIKEK